MNALQIEDIYPLSPMQQGMLFHALYAPETGNYHEQNTWNIEGELNVRAFQQAWQAVVNRHSALRTAFAWEELEAPLQIVYQSVELPFTQLDWRDVPVAEQDGRLQTYLAVDRERGFDLTDAPLMRLTLIRTEENSHLFIWSHHHLLLDGWSQPILFQELFAHYETLQQGTPLPMPPAQPFSSYIGWIVQQDSAAAETFWRNSLANLTAPTSLPIGDGVQNESGTTDTATLQLPATITAKLQTLAHDNRITLNTIVQGAWALLLHRYSSEDEIVYGATTSGRPPALPHIESMVGLFINTLPVRVKIHHDQTTRDWLRQLHQQLISLRDYEYVPLTDIHGWSEIPRDQPLFETLFVFENYPMDETLQQVSQMGQLAISERIHFSRTNYPLMLAVSPSSELNMVVGYDNGRFPSDTIHRLTNHLQTLLTGIATNPDCLLTNLPLVTEQELHQQLFEWNNMDVPFPSETAVHHRIETHAAQQPDAIAVTFADQKLSYKDLNKRANQLAHHLIKQNITPGDIVGICLNRSPEMIIAVLATLKAGAAYLPLDPTYPEKRLAFMIEDAKPKAILSQEAVSSQLSAISRINKKQKTENGKQKTTPHSQFQATKGSINNSQLIILPPDWNDFSHHPITNPAISQSPTSLAYLIYTSGSTGKPKGTLLHHRGLANFVHQYGQLLNITPTDRMLQFAAFSFDASVGEIFLALCHGATLQMAPHETITSPTNLAQLLQTEKTSVAILTPAILTAMTVPEDGLPSLTRLMFAGESCPVDTARRWQNGRYLFNGYGPTEASIGITHYEIKDIPADTTNIPIGKPIDNALAILLDSQQRPVPVGVPGELYIGGVGVAQGYLNRPELTAKRFVRLDGIGEQGSGIGRSISGPQPPAPVYRTGDLCRWLPDGTLEFLGRVDHQVKIRGFRIELREIEAVLEQHEAVRETAVITHEQPSGDKQLVAYAVLAADTACNSTDLYDFLKDKLPIYMVPAAFVLLDAMPLLPNGKINRRALPAPDGTTIATQFVAPRHATEEILAGLWAQVLDIELVGIHDSFFTLGGHSIKATRLVSRIRETFDVDLPLRQLFEQPTVAETAVFLQSTTTHNIPPITPIDRDSDIPLSFAQQRLWFLEQLSPGNLFYNIPLAIRLTGSVDIAALQQSLHTIVQRHETLRTTFGEINGRPIQQIAPTLTLDMPCTDLRHLPPDERESQAHQLIEDEVKRPFNLATGPLIRANLLQLADNDHIALLTMHHIISDGWSLGVLIQEIAILYTAYTAGEPSPLPELPVQYADFAHWQRTQLQGETLNEQLDYWRQQLQHAPPILDLPTDHPRPAVQTASGATEIFELPANLGQSLTELSQQEGVTLFMTLLAAFQTLLYRYTGQTDISVGTPIANRTRAEIEGLIGFFVNTLVLRADLSDTPDFNELLSRVREVALGAYAHQDVPFEMLVETVQPKRNMSHTPLFQVMFVLDNAPLGAMDLPGLKMESLAADTGAATFDLTLTMRESADGLMGTIEYNTDLFNQETIQRMVGHYHTLLDGIVADPERPISELPLLTPAEQQQMLVDWNDTATPYPDNTTIHALIEQHAVERPDVTAVSLNTTTLSYAELNGRANQLAHHLIETGVTSGDIIGIATHRTPEMIVGILATLKAGAAYLPLDPSYPPERLAFMIEDAQPKAILSQEAVS
ncbi:MAG: amino acid adenylation domain-containing protein, partial [Chloroflexi bacterium]